MKRGSASSASSNSKRSRSYDSVQHVINSVNGSFAAAGDTVRYMVKSKKVLSKEDAEAILASYLIDKDDQFCNAVYSKPRSYFENFGAGIPKTSRNQLAGNNGQHAKLFFDHLEKQKESSSCDKDLIDLFRSKFIDLPSTKKKVNDSAPPNAIEALKSAIVNERAVFVAGTGVSSSLTAGTDSSGVVTWDGLLNALKDKISKYTGFTADWPADAVNDPFKKADFLVRFSEERNLPVDYRQFVFELLSNLVVNLNAKLGTHQSIAEALSAFQLPISTTNYDVLLESCLGKFARNADKFQFDEYRPFIYHIHGLFYDAADIVLTEDAQTFEVFMQGIRQIVGNQLKRSLIFVGCLYGAVDHHFDGLWRAVSLECAEQNFILLSTSGLETLEKEPNFVAATSRGVLTPIVFGDSHKDLIPFLWKLAHECGWSESTTDSPALGLKKVIQWKDDKVQTSLN